MDELARLSSSCKNPQSCRKNIAPYRKKVDHICKKTSRTCKNNDHSCKIPILAQEKVCNKLPLKSLENHPTPIRTATHLPLKKHPPDHYYIPHPTQKTPPGLSSKRCSLFLVYCSVFT